MSAHPPLPFPPLPTPNGSARLGWHGLTQARGDRLLFDELTALLGPGEILWVQGDNGAGKTSLLRLICGLAEPLQGEVKRDPVGHVLFLGHKPGLKDALTAVENLRSAAALSGNPVTPAQAEAALAALGLLPLADLRVGQLSEGQRRRVSLARLFLPGPPATWVLDEPLAALDADSVARVAARIDTHAAGGGLVVYSSHQALPLRRPVSSLRLGSHAH